MSSNKHNLITANTTSLMFSLFDVALVRDVPFGISHCIQCILHGLTSLLLCVTCIFADSVDLVIARNDFLCVMEIILFLIVATLITEVLFK